MAYNSWMEKRSVPTDLTAEVANDLFRVFCDGNPDAAWLTQYTFEPTEYGELAVGMPDDDYYGRHYADRALAEFMATIIRPGEYATLTFKGEDGNAWGYLIGRDGIQRLRTEWVLEDGTKLVEFLSGKTGKGVA
jgi:hypothetical protein